MILGELKTRVDFPDPKIIKTRVAFNYYAVFDLAKDSLIFVDSVSIPESHSEDQFYDDQFDMDGEYFYYRKRSSALRFHIASGRIDTLKPGNVPVVPKNSTDILVYSTDEEKLKLLDWDLNERSFIKTDFTTPITAYSLSEDVFVIGHRVRSYGFPHVQVSMDVVLYDSKKGNRVLLHNTNLAEILDIELID